MKRFFITFSFILISLLSFIPNSYALTEDEQLHLDYFISEFYDIDNYPKCIFSSSAWSTNSSSQYICFSEEVSSKIMYKEGKLTTFNGNSFIYFSMRLNRNYSSNTFLVQDYLPSSYVSSGELEINILYDSFYHNFDIYNYPGDTLYSSKNLSLSPTIYYYVSFNIPDNSTLEVKDDTGNILEPISDYKYSLTEGHYSYSVYKEGYYSKENIDFTVTSDSTINVELESKFNPNNMQSIFTQYYNYIRDLVNDLFPLENPLFLFVVTFIIGFSIMALIKKLVGGLF